MIVSFVLNRIQNIFFINFGIYFVILYIISISEIIKIGNMVGIRFFTQMFNEYDIVLKIRFLCNIIIMKSIDVIIIIN